MAPLHRGARAPQCKIINMQNNAKLTVYLESILISVSFGPKLAPNEVAWYIFNLNQLRLVRCT